MFILCFVSILCGLFEFFCILFIFIIVHEFCHYVVGSLFKWKLEYISLYLYGGSTVFKDILNKPLKEEFFVLIAGPIGQILFYMLIMQFDFGASTLSLVNTIHYSLLFFNMLPIYPLDGGRIVNIILSFFFSYKMSFNITIVISWSLLISFLLLSFTFGISINLLFLLTLLGIKLGVEWKKRNYYFNKFLLERYLYRLNFNKCRIVKTIEQMYRDSRHIFKINDKIYSERAILEKKFIKNVDFKKIFML